MVICKDMDAAAIRGNASYLGVAVGVHATRTFTDGVQTDAATGRFTAVANLSATFGARSTASGRDGAYIARTRDGDQVLRMAEQESS